MADYIVATIILFLYIFGREAGALDLSYCYISYGSQT